MKQRITDLLDGMEFEGVELTERPETPVNSIRERTMKKVRQSTRAKKTHTLFPIKRAWQVAACIVLIVSIGTVTAFAANSAFRNKLLSVLRLETHDTNALSPMNTETFTTVEGMDGVSIHYIPLNEHFYEPSEGVLISYNGEPYFQAVTEDYQLEVLDTKEVNEIIQWRGETRTLHFAYTTYQDQMYFKNLGGVSVTRYLPGDPDEVLIWIPFSSNGIDDIPVVYNLSTGALTDLTEKIDWDSLPGEEERAGLGYWNGILYYVDYSYNASTPSQVLYRVSCDTGEVVQIPGPEAGRAYLDNGSFYWMTPARKLYRLDEQDQWIPLLEEISNLTEGVNGLMTGETKENELVVADLLNDTIYEIPDLEVGGYHAYRYNDSSLIALVRMNLGIANGLGVSQLGILSPEDGQVHLLERDMNTQDSCCGWFDENRFVIICTKDGQRYLCLYEFE